MKITYLKSVFSEQITSVGKFVNDDITITVHGSSINIYDYNMSKDLIKNDYVVATKEEFDNFYIETAKKINEASKI